MDTSNSNTATTTTTETHNTNTGRTQRGSDLRTAGIALGVVVGFNLTWGLAVDGYDWAKQKLAARKAAAPATPAP